MAQQTGRDLSAIIAEIGDKGLDFEIESSHDNLVSINEVWSPYHFSYTARVYGKHPVTHVEIEVHHTSGSAEEALDRAWAKIYPHVVNNWRTAPTRPR